MGRTGKLCVLCGVGEKGQACITDSHNQKPCLRGIEQIVARVGQEVSSAPCGREVISALVPLALGFTQRVTPSRDCEEKSDSLFAACPLFRLV